MTKRDNNGFGIDRRGFLKGFASATVAAGLVGSREVFADENSASERFGRGLLAPPAIDATPGTEKYWKKVRKAFGLGNDYIHMNTGTTGSQPEFVQNNLAAYNFYKSQDPRDWSLNLAADFPDLFPVVPSAIGARQLLVANTYGANADEIVLSYNTTDACNLIFAGTPWQSGDRIITTTFEHPALAGPIAWARDHHGVDVVMIDIPSNFTADITVNEVLGWFETELVKDIGTENKQYLAISEIFYKNGLRMPVPELCALARRYGAFSIIDSAHGWGMLPINCHAYGADFIVGAGHKWLCGGPGTGICYVRTSDATDHPLPPFAMGNFFIYGNPFVAPSVLHQSRNWSPALYMQMRGEYNVTALYAMTDSLSFFAQIGIDNIYERALALGNYLKSLIAAQWGPEALWVQENPDERFATGLTAFNPFANKDDGASFAAMNSAINVILSNLALETPKIYIRSISWRSSQSVPADDRVGLRIATHAMYNNYDEIDHVFARLVNQVNLSGLAQL